MLNFGPFSRGQPHQEPQNEDGSLSLAKCILFACINFFFENNHDDSRMNEMLYSVKLEATAANPKFICYNFPL